MEALLERVYYPSAIIAGNALYGANCSAISAWNFRPIIPASIKVSQWKSHGCNPVRIFEITPPRFVVTRCDRWSDYRNGCNDDNESRLLPPAINIIECFALFDDDLSIMYALAKTNRSKIIVWIIRWELCVLCNRVPDSFRDNVEIWYVEILESNETTKPANPTRLSISACMSNSKTSREFHLHATYMCGMHYEPYICRIDTCRARYENWLEWQSFVMRYALLNSTVANYQLFILYLCKYYGYPLSRVRNFNIFVHLP